MELLKQYKLVNNKHIPDIYKYNTREIRLQVLAGLLDTDGYLSRNNCYEIIQKRKILSDDIVFLARSLGFYCSQNSCQKTCTNSSKGSVTGTYYRCNISSTNLDLIPTKLSRKQCIKNNLRTDPLNIGFKIEKINDKSCIKIEKDEQKKNYSWRFYSNKLKFLN